MSNCKHCLKLMPEALFGQMSPEDNTFFFDHLNSCQKCRKEYEEMKNTQKIIIQRKRPQIDNSFWEGYWDRLKARMENENLLSKEEEIFKLKAKQSWWNLPRWAYQSAAAVLILTAGILIGKMVFSPTLKYEQTAQFMTQKENDPVDKELMQRAQNYIQQSKYILLAFDNFDTQKEDIYTLDLPYKQQQSRQLLNEAYWIKEKLSDSNQNRLDELIEDLEAILLQIANLESESDLSAVDLVRTGVDSRGILLKIHLAEYDQLWEKISDKKPAGLKTETSKRF